ncbi:hypothetical protein BYT27DRAFT_7226947 [Phlegmacium glaucopus]|nr:hypothetical protein BYT27DRAFT_7226947 [Phlegmacium glaucopus]
MPAIRQNKISSHSTKLLRLANIHGGHMKYQCFCPQPYPPQPPISSVNPRHSTLLLPSNLVEKINQAQGAAVSKSTQEKDASRLRDFLVFCEGLGIHNKHALPAREDLLIAWASSYAGQLAGKTVSAKISAVKKEHACRGLPWYGSEHLQLILKGVEGLRPPSSFFAKRSPILPPTKDVKKFDLTRHATFAHITESTATNGSCNLHLPWSKTQKARGDDVWIPRQEAPLDPIHALHKHFLKNRLLLSHPIAAYPKFIQRINQILQSSRQKYPRITGHCIRIGGTTFYLISGVPPDMVKKFGRWRSQAFLEYWCCLDYLGKIHLDMLPLNLQSQP